MSDEVRYERDGAIGTITLDRPDNRNSMTPDLLDAFVGASARARADAELRALVITRSVRQQGQLAEQPRANHPWNVPDLS